MKGLVIVMSALGIATGGSAAPALAQQASASTAAEQSRYRYQIGQVERVLEGAVEHGASIWRERFRSIMPADMLLAESVRVRGFRLEGYGVFFDVEVPSLQTAPLWSLRTLDQNDLGLSSALDALRSFVDTAGDPGIQQALKRVELQVAPVPLSPNAGGTLFGGARNPTGAPASLAAPGPAPADRVVGDPAEAYRAEVRNALMDAMLDHSRGLDIAPPEWLAVAARRSDERVPLAPLPLDTDARTVIIRVRGSDLTAFLGGQISRDDARKRMEVKVF